jgi:pyridinium-3,5-biscarboxylic acid mononucleotide sulfurtransferase
VTPELMGQIERAEAAVTALGFNELRVRHHGEVARIEVPDEAFDSVMAQRGRLIEALKDIGYTYVSLDLQGLRNGSMNEVLAARA